MTDSIHFPLPLEYNCCKKGVLPDMKHFSHLEISGHYLASGIEDNSFTESIEGIASGTVELNSLGLDINEDDIFFTIYGRENNGNVQALHDVDTLKQAKGIALELGRVFPFLSGPKLM